MYKKYIVTLVEKKWRWCESYFRYTLPEFYELINSMYDNQEDALEAVIKFVIFWTNDTNLRDRYFKDKFELSVDHFIISPAPDYWVDSEEDIPSSIT